MQYNSCSDQVIPTVFSGSYVKDIYLHYNPCKNGTNRLIKFLNKEEYKDKSYGTLYIQEIEKDFQLVSRIYLESENDMFYLKYGESKLDYQDRYKYDRKVGRDIAISRAFYRPVKIVSIQITKGVIWVKLETESGFKFMIEYNYITKKYFIQTLGA